MKGILKDKKFIKTMLILALPITFQSFITSSLNLVDNLMIGKLGEDAIAAVGLANQYFFIFMLALTGINAGASVFMAQYWGKKDLKNIKSVLGLDILVGIGATVLFGLGAIFFSENIMSILSNDSSVIKFGASYLKIVSISYIFTNLTMAFSSVLRSTQQPNIPMYASLIGVLSNAFLNWLFIFGNLGMPELGVNGAALATVLARGIEMIFIISVVYIKKNKVASSFKELTNFNKMFVKKYFNTATPTILNELVWSFGMTAFSIAYAQIGTSAVATMQIATTLNNMFMVLCIGLATAASIMIGNKIGADEEDVALDYSKKIGIISPIIGLIIGLSIVFLAPLIVAPFNVTDKTYIDTLRVLYIMAVFCPIRFFNIVMIIGIFRGGGDTKYSMLVQAGTVWGFAVPIAFIGATILNLPVTAVYFLICLEEIVKIIFEFIRLKSGKWVKAVV
ncbi:MATE family efflux transporter [Clostridium sp. Ade.TY]|uniref:MATE family efflux transporter n=1 Tax=Clostridium sp. Ade.TY TaxID=1391647 RepID=UPI00040AE26B|nr:MATE family efflux transporter [Clostridium sp. Ade.TY]